MCVGEFAVDGMSQDDLTPPSNASNTGIQGPFLGENEVIYLTPVKSERDKAVIGSATILRTFGCSDESAFVTPDVAAKVKVEKYEVCCYFVYYR